MSVNQRRYAVTSALAATAVPALVMARGHRVSQVPELPLVVSFANVEKTKDAIAAFQALGASEDVDKAKASMHARTGVSRSQTSRYSMRRGPLLVTDKRVDGDKARAFRNLSGVEICDVSRLNLLQLAPGSHVGRFVVWSKAAFEALDKLYGTAPGAAAELKSGFTLPRAPVATPDIHRIINSDEVQKVVRARTEKPKPRAVRGNPLRNKKLLVRLNPYADVSIRAERRAQEARAAAKAAGTKPAAKKRAATDAAPASSKKQRRAFVEKLLQ